ncbi:hypothetical protein [Corynebacterium meitnerae]|uniref:Uncharacterized protein n=1 Tax=Corynebacterium meitnerae TaxID=2913498 RepID=A0A9X3RJ63_9CORY|nr:hypothetical protein [Corynebacterium meitnerae]MCZ9293645.1 hypothetical protein [Corynebacterium meitnerae]
MSPIDRSVQIFKEHGWDTAAREDAPTLPLGTKDQQRTALAGLQKGTPRVDVDLGMLGMFAIRLGVNGRRAAELAKGSDQALLDCLLQRDEKFALAFAERACWLWANADSMSENVAVGLILKHRLDMPYTLPCLEAWTVTACQGLAGSAPGRDTWIPSLDDLRPSFATHLRAALALGVSVDGPLGAVLPMGVQQGLISRDEALQHAITGLDTAPKPWGRKELVRIITEDLSASDSELLDRVAALVLAISMGEGPVVEALAPRLISFAPPEVVAEVALPALYAKTVKAKRAVVEALAGRSDLGPEQTDLLADRLGELAAERNTALAKQAQRILDGWEVVYTKPAVAPTRRAPKFKAKEFDADEFNRVWPADAGTASRIDDGAHISAHWEDPDASHRTLMCHLTLPTGQTVKLRTFTGDFLSEGWVLSTENERVFFDGERVVAEPFGNKERNAWQRRKKKRITDQKTRSDSLFGVCLTDLATDGDVSIPRNEVEQLVVSGELGWATVRAVVTQLIPGGAWSPARAIQDLETKPELLPALWPMLTEPLVFAAEHTPVPKWVNRVLDVVTLHQEILAEATRRGYIPADAWDGLHAFASQKGSSVALKKARALSDALRSH